MAAPQSYRKEAKDQDSSPEFFALDQSFAPRVNCCVTLSKPRNYSVAQLSRKNKRVKPGKKLLSSGLSHGIFAVTDVTA